MSCIKHKEPEKSAADLFKKSFGRISNKGPFEKMTFFVSRTLANRQQLTRIKALGQAQRNPPSLPLYPSLSLCRKCSGRLHHVARPFRLATGQLLLRFPKRREPHFTAGDAVDRDAGLVPEGRKRGCAGRLGNATRWLIFLDEKELVASSLKKIQNLLHAYI